MLGLADQTAFITPADITPADTAAAQSATLSWGGQAGDENRRCGLGWRAVPAFSKSGFTESGDRRRGVQATLAMRVLVRLGWTALTVVAANIVYALSHNLFDANHLAENIVRGKAQRIALRVAASVGADQVDREEAVPEPDGVSFRVIDPNRTILAERNAALVDRASTLNAQNLRNAVFQVSHVTMDGKDYTWGVARHQIGGRQALVEITFPADMQRAAWHAVTDELSLHVWVPLIPSALLFLLLAHWSVHSGHEPLSSCQCHQGRRGRARAAAQARRRRFDQ